MDVIFPCRPEAARLKHDGQGNHCLHGHCHSAGPSVKCGSHLAWDVHDAGVLTDTRAQAARILGSFDRNERKSIVRTCTCVLIAGLVVWLPGWMGLSIYDGLSDGGRASLGIVVLAASLWISEAMPAFAVALLVIGLQVAILGRPGGVFAEEGDSKAWLMFVSPWASSIMWLFIGGFVLAHACAKTKLDEWLAGMLLSRLMGKPALLVLGVMVVTYVFSMFMSNTATAAMVMTMTAPVLLSLGKDAKLGRGIVLAVACGANLGGMATIIGTPPNAIAAGQLPADQKISFIEWMSIALPPSLVLAGVAFAFIWWRYVRGDHTKLAALKRERSDDKTLRQRVVVMVFFTITLTLWMGGSFWGISAPVASLLPIVGLAVSGVMTAEDINKLPWDVLLLLAGGLSLGVGVKETGLAVWFADQIPADLPPLGIAMAFAMVGLVLSNLMSNTAAAALLIPLAASLVAPDNVRLVMLSVAIACSSAMCLPISTPPNAIAYSSGRLRAIDFMVPGLIIAILIPLVVLWLKLVA